MTTVGILGLQGDVREHAAAVSALGAHPLIVRRVHELDDVDAFIIPGGESTTMSTLLHTFDLGDPLQERLLDGLPVLGTCAGMIALATDLSNPAAGQRTLGVIDMEVRRNAFGRQVDSAEMDITWRPDPAPMRATFIRAPWVERVGPGVEVLATVRDHGEDRIVAVRQGSAIATAFHPEVSADLRIHRALLAHTSA